MIFKIKYLIRTLKMNSNTNSDTYKERLKFYADTPKGDNNKFFCFKVDILNLEPALFRFWKKGFNIRAAWYEKINTETGDVENLKIDIQTSLNRYLSLSPKERKII
jgi:hypothetical protein